jgi:hypothetical protein
MVLFTKNLSEIEARLMENIKKSRFVFSDEITVIEKGLLLMKELTKVSAIAISDYERNPHLFSNHNLFARNRELLLNCYICILTSSYGTHNVIARTVLENNQLMRLFRKNDQKAFEWLSKETQSRFSGKIQEEYGKSNLACQTFRPSDVRKLAFLDQIRGDIKVLYDQLCNYTHPNYEGWKHLVYRTGDKEYVLRTPHFVDKITDGTIGLTVYLIKSSIKEFVETFRFYLKQYPNLAERLDKWQKDSNQILFRHVN